ncbi:MAG: AMP-binding protein, partial [Mycobacterium sp.]|nr:AMP-binding protein [Mycobacterium sp.]
MTVLPTVTDLLAALADVDDRGVRADDGSETSWRNHIQHAADLAAMLRSRLNQDRPPHVGVLSGNTPLFSALLVAAGLSGLVPVGLNPTRRGAALRRDIAHADCQLVLADSGVQALGAEAVPDSVTVLDVTSPAWAAELGGFGGSPIRPVQTSLDDLFMLIFTSGTSGDPKAVRCTHEK